MNENRKSAPKTFTYERRVAFADTDMAGIMHFANYYRYMEEAEHAFFRMHGLTITKHLEEGLVLGWPRVSAQCSFEAPARYDDIIEIELYIERIGMKSLTFYSVFRINNKQTAHGRMKTACCLCKAHGKLVSIPIPEEYLEKFREYELLENR